MAKTIVAVVVALLAGCGGQDAAHCPLAGRLGTSHLGSDCSFTNGVSTGSYAITEQHTAPDGIVNYTMHVTLDASAAPDVRSAWDYGSECKSFTVYVQESNGDGLLTTWATDRFFRCVQGY